jgi:cytochrome c-type biogenesis protein CcmH/NrfG
VEPKAQELLKSKELLLDEIALRRASISDAQQEFKNGDLTESELKSLVARDELAITRLEQELNTATSTKSVKAHRRRRRSLLIVGVSCLLVAALGSVLTALSIRQAGSSSTGNLSLSQSQRIHQLSLEAEADLADGNVTAALSAYQQILGLDSKNPEALIQSGWLTFSAASTKNDAKIVARGISLLTQAISVAPLNPAAHLYYGIVAASTPQNQKLAKEQFILFLRLHPSTTQLAIAQPFLLKYKLRTK